MTHRRAVTLRQMPTENIKADALNRMSAECHQRVLGRVIGPDDCTLSVEKYLRALAPTAKLVIVSEITNLHGLVGKASNAAKETKRDAFRALVKLNRSPIGRTVDKNNCGHATVWHLNSIHQVLVPAISKEFPDDRPSFLGFPLKALESKNRNPISPRTLQRWMDLDFGSTKLYNGYPVPNEEHTTIFPQFTNACNICCEFDVEEEHYEASLNRDRQQGDQGSLSKAPAAEDTQTAYDDLMAERRRHRSEAAAAMEYHKSCVKKAYANFISNLL